MKNFLPSGPKGYNTAIYTDKLTKLATVISQIGVEKNPDGPALLGVAEIENDTVLRDLANHPLLKRNQYRFVHYDSRDVRGVDVGLFYNPKYFTVEQSDKLFVQLPGGSKDCLFHQGYFMGERETGWRNDPCLCKSLAQPARREERSSPGKGSSRTSSQNHIDSITALTPWPRSFLLGDLNDDPVNTSVAVVLNARGKEKEVMKGGFLTHGLKCIKMELARWPTRIHGIFSTRSLFPILSWIRIRKVFSITSLIFSAGNYEREYGKI
jgi:hypothetical protein